MEPGRVDVIFSDECRFGLQNNARQSRGWRKAEENNNPAFFKPVFLRAPSVVVWGCITRNGVGKLVVVDGNIDAVKYCNIIDKSVPLSVEQCFGDQHHPVIFQHDNASPHSGRYLQLRKLLRIRWPSQSPDLKPRGHLF